MPLPQIGERIIRLSERQAMLNLLLAAAVAAASLVAIAPAAAKSLWLNCGGQVINLDSAKERFSLTADGTIYQGSAMFSPNQIDFEFQWRARPDGGGLKLAYSIDRKSLNYTMTSLSRVVVPGHSDSGWKPQRSETFDNPIFGKCFIMKTPPTSGNLI